jgi:hypothetical protein
VRLATEDEAHLLLREKNTLTMGMVSRPVDVTLVP